jgi:von Willebrand factor type A domain
MFRSVLVLSLTASAAVLSTAADAQTPQKSASARTRDIYVSVQGRDDTPVTGLRPDDFVVREDGVLREVLKAERAAAPLLVVLLVDDSAAMDPAIAELRLGLNAFVDKLQGKGEIGLVTIGERPTSIAEPTSNLDAIKKAVSRIFSRPGSGAYFLEGLSDVARGLQKREAARPAIVAVISEGVEFSNLDSTGVLNRLVASRATLHVLSIGTPSDSMSDEVRNRNIVVADGTARTGGRRDQVLTPSGLPDKLRKLADELTNQYVVTYGVPDALIPPERLEVSVKQAGATARARMRVQGK